MMDVVMVSETSVLKRWAILFALADRFSVAAPSLQVRLG